jgi:hypothetical protein
MAASPVTTCPTKSVQSKQSAIRDARDDALRHTTDKLMFPNALHGQSTPNVGDPPCRRMIWDHDSRSTRHDVDGAIRFCSDAVYSLSTLDLRCRRDEVSAQRLAKQSLLVEPELLQRDVPAPMQRFEARPRLADESS